LLKKGINNQAMPVVWPRVLVTGATGFVGNALLEAMVRDDRVVSAAVRCNDASLIEQVTQYPIGDLSSNNNFSDALKGVDVVIHLAARVHVIQESSLDPLTEFRKINKDATLNLARQAVEAGVKRFIFLSSIKVNGEITQPGEVFAPDDRFVPIDPYGLSKQEAEHELLELARETGLEVVIIRPPLVYGPAVKGNFALMMKWLIKGIPLPFGSVHNRRSLLALDNLVSFIICCVGHPKAANEIFLVSDGADVSTTELLQKVAKALGKKPLLLPVPVGLMRFFARMIGRSDVADRMFNSLRVDDSKARNLLGWAPVITMGEQLKITAETYLKRKSV